MIPRVTNHKVTVFHRITKCLMNFRTVFKPPTHISLLKAFPDDPRELQNVFKMYLTKTELKYLQQKSKLEGSKVVQISRLMCSRRLVRTECLGRPWGRGRARVPGPRPATWQKLKSNVILYIYVCTSFLQGWLIIKGGKATLTQFNSLPGKVSCTCCHRTLYVTRSLGALRAPTSRLRPFGPA